MTPESQTPEELRAAWRRLQQEQPQLRNRDVAARLGVSEAELVASACGEGAVRLDEDLDALLAALPSLGVVMALTRNAHAVIEKVGAYNAPERFGAMGQVVGEDIDLRLFLRVWRAGFALRLEGPRGIQRSLQFFDARGDAVHKIFLRPESDLGAFDALVAARRFGDQSPAQSVEAPARPAARPETEPEIDGPAFLAAWDGMTDTHDFFGVLRRFQLDRLPALRLAGPERARPVDLAGLLQTLERAAAAALPIMVFVGSPGVVQIHKGPVERIKVTGEWLNVLDPGFNLHVHQPGLTSLWVVRKPTADGAVTSLEAYDERGELVVQLFGRRKPGQAELPAWRQLATGLI